MAFAPYMNDIVDYRIFDRVDIQHLALQYDSDPDPAEVAIFLQLQAIGTLEDPAAGAGRLRVSTEFTTGNPVNLFDSDAPVDGIGDITTTATWYVVANTSPYGLVAVTYDPSTAANLATADIGATNIFDSPDSMRIIRSFSYFWTDN